MGCGLFHRSYISYVLNNVDALNVLKQLTSVVIALKSLELKIQNQQRKSALSVGRNMHCTRHDTMSMRKLGFCGLRAA
jgi:hypothetical protein